MARSSQIVLRDLLGNNAITVAELVAQNELLEEKVKELTEKVKSLTPAPPVVEGEVVNG